MFLSIKSLILRSPSDLTYKKCNKKTDLNRSVLNLVGDIRKKGHVAGVFNSLR